MTVRVQRDDFDLGAELAALRRGRTDIGALVSFSGLVRESVPDPSEPDRPIRLEGFELEHYPAMTLKALEEIEGAALDRWPIQASLILHRYGRLAPGEQIMMVATASAHRAAAFEAAQFLMDYLKSRAPFWKRETTARGSHWVDARSSDEDARMRWSDRRD